MKHTTIATSALALGLSMIASGAFATVITNAFENFDSCVENAGVASLVDSVGFTWTAGESDQSKVNASSKLALDTGDSSVTGALANASTFNANIAKNASFEAKVNFVPATEAPSITGSDLKFALYALAETGSTNLYVYTGTSTNTTLDVSGGEKTVRVEFQSANTFKVSVDDSELKGPYTFASGSGVNLVEFQGSGELDDVGFFYAGYAEDDSPTIHGDSVTTPHELTATEADYLNDLVAAKGDAAVKSALEGEGMTVDTFEKAALLNQDITTSNAGSYDFDITSLKRISGGVEITATLNRKGSALGAIRGEATLYTGTTPTAITEKSEIVFDFPAAGAGTQTSTTNIVTEAKFFKVVIEEK